MLLQLKTHLNRSAERTEAETAYVLADGTLQICKHTRARDYRCILYIFPKVLSGTVAYSKFLRGPGSTVTWGPSLSPPLPSIPLRSRTPHCG